ncbi:hypothetical protein ABWH96_11380 [Marivirga tractuosa]|uniref:hypothetical protein n=1 Tax=Marivirga tractuosa TaxID=1006 RepID=UPI0035D0FFCC
MPNFNLLILPILGAFYFIEVNHYFKVKYSLHDRQRYIYTSFLFAFYLLVPAFLISAGLKHYFPEFSYWILSKLPIKEKHIGTSLLSFLIGLSSSHILNKIRSKEKIFKKLVEKYGGDAERLIQECFYQKELLAVSLKNEKVYIGFITEFKASLDNTYIALDPVFSGFRDEERKLILTTDYLEAFETFETFYPEKEKQTSQLQDQAGFSKLLIKKEEIRTFSKFDMDLYMAFNESEKQESN